MTQPGYAYTDHARLLADLQAGDEAAIADAYRRVFSSDLGRMVLTHQLAEAGVGQIRDPQMTGLERAHHDGAANHALSILNLAGFDRMSAAHAVAADVLEGRNNDGHQQHGRDDSGDGGRGGGFSGPDSLVPD